MKVLLLFLASITAGTVIIMLFNNLSPQSRPNLVTSKTNIAETSRFSLENAPSLTLKGQIATISGQVNLLARTATEPSQLKVPIEIQQGENLYTEDNSRANILFSDIADIHLLPQSELEFVQLLPSSFVFNLAKGTVEFTKNSLVPVSVRVLHLLVQQESGDMTVSIDKNQPIVTITITQGSVTLAYNNSQNISSQITIASPHQATFNDITRLIKTKKI